MGRLRGSRCCFGLGKDAEISAYAEVYASGPNAERTDLGVDERASEKNVDGEGIGYYEREPVDVVGQSNC